MKKLFVLFLMLTASFPLLSNDRPVDVDRLPVKAREFIDRYFKDVEVSLATVDRELLDTTYEVFFVGGSKVEFGKNGEWKNVDCRHSRVPAGIVPKDISRYVSAKYPKSYVTEIDRDARDYEVKLDNGLELTFNHRFQLIGIDD